MEPYAGLALDQPSSDGYKTQPYKCLALAMQCTQKNTCIPANLVTLSHWSHVTCTYVLTVPETSRPASPVPRQPRKQRRYLPDRSIGSLAAVGAVSASAFLSHRRSMLYVCSLFLACPVRFRLVPFLPWNPRWRKAPLLLVPSVDRQQSMPRW